MDGEVTAPGRGWVVLGAGGHARSVIDVLERAGHTVTIVAPKMRGRRAVAADAAYVDTPSIPITPDREYSLAWPGRRTDRFVDALPTNNYGKVVKRELREQLRAEADEAGSR